MYNNLKLFKGCYDAEHHVYSLSGGKDSVCMVLMAIDRGIRIDEIIFCDTSVEFPEIYETIDQLEKQIDIPITRLKETHDFEYYMLQHQKKSGKIGYGWPDFKNRWCTQLLKKSVISKYLRKYKKAGIKVIEYHGIAVDEKERALSNNEKIVKYPLIDWEITEAQALQYCYSKGFTWSGLYNHFDRLSCWLCPLQKLSELKILYLHYPEKWNKMKELEGKSFNRFRLDYTFEKLENKFSQ